MEVPEEIQVRYMERRKKDLEMCLKYLGKENFKELEKVGHQLKGNGLTFGFSELSTIGTYLEQAASKKNMIEVEKVLEDFSEWVSQNIH